MWLQTPPNSDSNKPICSLFSGWSSFDCERYGMGSLKLYRSHRSLVWNVHGKGTNLRTYDRCVYTHLYTYRIPILYTRMSPKKKRRKIESRLNTNTNVECWARVVARIADKYFILTFRPFDWLLTHLPWTNSRIGSDYSNFFRITNSHFVYNIKY